MFDSRLFGGRGPEFAGGCVLVLDVDRAFPVKRDGDLGDQGIVGGDLCRMACDLRWRCDVFAAR